MKIITFIFFGLLLSGCALDKFLVDKTPTTNRKSEFLDCIIKLHEAGIKQELLENLCQKAMRE